MTPWRESPVYKGSSVLLLPEEWAADMLLRIHQDGTGSAHPNEPHPPRYFFCESLTRVIMVSFTVEEGKYTVLRKGPKNRFSVNFRDAIHAKLSFWVMYWQSDDCFITQWA